MRIRTFISILGALMAAPFVVFAYGQGSYIPPPGAPGAPTYSNVTKTSMRVSWTAASDGTTYYLERCTGSGCTPNILIGSTGSLFLDVSNLTAGTVYRYRVYAVNVSGSGPYSSVTETTTVAASPHCSDGFDNDSDGQTDFSADAGCSSTSDTDELNAGLVRVYLTTGTSWTVPNNWNSSSNIIAAIGGGGAGTNGSTGAGGGGGAYAAVTNVSLTAGASVPYTIGAGGVANGGAGGDTTFNTSTVVAKGGGGGGASGGTGGTAAASTGTTKYSGGNGGRWTSGGGGGGGGGGAAGPVGNGANGGTSDNNDYGGAGGGGGGGGTAGLIGGLNNTTGGIGGNNFASGGAGNGGSSAGTNGGGGGGGNNTLGGYAGGAGTDWITHGAGGGGGGGGRSNATGGAGGLYGGGGAGAGYSAGTGGAGGQGVIVITYVPAGLPSVTTNAASSIGQTTATLNGTITSTGNSNPTVRGFAYGTTANLTGSVSTTTENGSFGAGAFSTGASSLSPNTTYYVRAYATNPVGTSYGSITNFTTTPGPPSVTTVAPSSVTISSMTLNGNVTATGGASPSQRGFAWGTSAALGSGTATTTQGAGGTGTFSADLSTLSAGTTYYSRAYATNSGGTGYGSTVSTTTPPGAPGTPSFSSVAQTAMRVSWTAGSGATSYKVERCSGAGCSNFSQITSGVAALFYDDSGLTANTSYSYRVRGTGSGVDGAYSSTGTRVTLAYPPGSAPGTPSFTNVTQTTLTVNWAAASGATGYEVERCQGAGCSSFSLVGTPGGTSLDDTGLTANTSYTYRVRGTSTGGPGPYSSAWSQVTASTGTIVPITGWAWSDTIGWIDLNCSNLGGCGAVNFGLGINSATGILSGFAWSENIGWITANPSDLTGCPSGTCNAAMTETTLTGWLKAVAGTDSQNGGWDGYIALSDTNTGDGIAYGIAYNAGAFSGFGWGDRNVGWVDFSLAQTLYNTCTPQTSYTCNGTQIIVKTDTDASCQPTVVDPYITCVAPQFCSAGSPVCLTPPPDGLPGAGDLTGNLIAKPNLVPRNATTTVYWDMANVTNCSVSSTNSSVWTGNTSATSSCPTKFGTGCTSLPITEQTIFTLSCLNLDSQPYTETATVNLVPGFEENCSPGFVHENGQCVPL